MSSNYWRQTWEASGTALAVTVATDQPLDPETVRLLGDIARTVEAHLGRDTLPEVHANGLADARRSLRMARLANLA